MKLTNQDIPLETKLLIIACIIPFLLIQATWIFRDARKRGERKYWLWGLFGLMNVPQSLIVYLIVTRIIMDKKKGDKTSK